MEPVAIVSKITISKEKVNDFLRDKRDEFVDEMKKIMNGTYPPGTVLILQYLEKINALVFIYWLECRSLDEMKAMPGAKTFFTIAGYKDINAADYAAFSTSAPNFMSDELWAAYKIEKDTFGEIPADQVPEEVMLQMDGFLYEFIFDVAAENRDSLDSGSQNPYEIFINEKTIHPYILKKYLQ